MEIQQEKAFGLQAQQSLNQSTKTERCEVDKMETIDCPYCGQEHDPTGCHETDSGENECKNCKKTFEVLIEYEPTYSTSKIEDIE